MYVILWTRAADRDLERMPQVTAQRIRAKIRALAVDPYAANNNVTQMKGDSGYRLRVGDWLSFMVSITWCVYCR